MLLFSILLVGLVCSVSAGNTVNLLTDIKIVYVYEDFENIDWASVYYFIVDNGCQVDIASVKKGPVYKQLVTESDRYNLRAMRFFVPDTTAEYLDTIIKDIFGDYAPDIVVFGSQFKRPEMQIFENHILGYKPEANPVDIIKKYYRRIVNGDENSIFIKSKQFMDNYGNEIADMVNDVFSRSPLIDNASVYTAFELIKSNIVISAETTNFLNGIERFKFDQVVASQIKSELHQTALRMNRQNYIMHVENAISSSGSARLESLLAARTELKKIRETYYYQIGKSDIDDPVSRYIENTLQSLSLSVFYEAGINHHAQAVIRDTPGGKRLKCRSEINNDGFLNIQGGYLELKPYWSEEVIIIDSNWTEILPNNSLIREYTIEVDPERLETIDEESFEFIGKIQYGDEIIDFKYKLSAYEKGALSIEFMPDFLVIKPFEKLRVDRLVEQEKLQAIITKPPEYTGEIEINVSTPENILAGAYQERITLNSGEKAVEVRIPIVATRSMSEQRQEVTVTISSDGVPLASDVAFIRQAVLDISPQKLIALLPDNLGFLEDIFVMAGADYKIISDRFLKTGDFNTYDVIIFGTGCFKEYESLGLAYDKFKKYLERGGNIIVFGQPDEWRDDLLPISLISMARSLDHSEITNSHPDHTLFKNKRKINITEMLENISGNYLSYPAVVFPCEKIIETANNTTLLATAKFGNGKFIYCGIPLAELVGNLDLEAINFLSNLVKYTDR